LEHPNPDRYAGQCIFVVRPRTTYTWCRYRLRPRVGDAGFGEVTPLALRAEADVEDEHTVFLKTIVPTRKATKEYLGEESDDEA
jgi:hypothetical protein